MTAAPHRTSFIEHRGVRLCFLDFHDVSDTPRALEAIAEARAIVARQPPRSVRTLVYVKGSRFDQEIVKAMKELAEHNKPFVIASAIVGMERLHRVVLTAVATFTRRKFATFTDLDAAKDWLAQQQ